LNRRSRFLRTSSIGSENFSERYGLVIQQAASLLDHSRLAIAVSSFSLRSDRYIWWFTRPPVLIVGGSKSSLAFDLRVGFP
jgi:hypothetical protein